MKMHFGIAESKTGPFRYLCTDKYVRAAWWDTITPEVKKVDCPKCLRKIQKEMDKLHLRAKKSRK